MTTSSNPLTHEQTLSASRIYQVETAVRTLNSEIDAIEPCTFPPSDFHFIARSWPDGSNAEPEFKFTYFTVPEFTTKKMRQILDAIHQDRQRWATLLSEVRHRDLPELRGNSDFFSFFHDLISNNKAKPDAAQLHYYFANLAASLPVTNLMPGVLWKHHNSDDSVPIQAPRAYLVNATADSNKASLPPLHIRTILPKFREHKPLPQERPSHYSPDAIDAYVELTLWLTDPNKRHPTPLHVPNTAPTHSTPDETRTTIWLPVYEACRGRRYFGRFLGWLFQFIDVPPPPYRNLSKVYTQLHFSQRLVFRGVRPNRIPNSPRFFAQLTTAPERTPAQPLHLQPTLYLGRMEQCREPAFQTGDLALAP